MVSPPPTPVRRAGIDSRQSRCAHCLANGWFYKAAAAQPSTFFDVTQGSNDLADVGCCQAAVGYDPASGVGVPNWAALPAALPAPG